ncbi:hypothetical protein FAZ15_01035 [Sphingobacterium olei]|uniref:Uncharacterized protein n=1 Tax=Sphingobacterium olei TaxID=2571155 RepID=A0A4U0P814_9SPHI|nr:hypothetical protein [Sphingobacterium olei]TJZ62922.1 hypothetical protein FAZ15_01035 [Sphingobacterium olei]
MEAIIDSMTYFIFALIIIGPILLLYFLKQKRVQRFHFLLYITPCFLFLFPIILLSAWRADWSNVMLLENYGYQFDGDDIEKYKNVSNENLPLVKNLEISIMGIGYDKEEKSLTLSPIAGKFKNESKYKWPDVIRLMQ